MPTIRYRFSDPNSSFSADFTIITETNPRVYTDLNPDQTGYAITSVTNATINGQTATLRPSNNQTLNPRTGDSGADGTNNVAQYTNVYWVNDTQGNASYSHYGIDNRGIALRVGSTDYKFGLPVNGVEQFGFTTDGTNFTNLNATVTQINNGVESPAPCYVTGTRILTASGEVTVEDLAVGDLAVTASGEARPVRWIGHRTVACHGRQDLLPVRIAAHAFGEGRPARDLLVSPGHAVCVDVLGEVLVPAIRLVNGTTVAQIAVESVTYWHVELDSHDILLAEGLPAESYLDMGNRRFFAEADSVDLAEGPDAPAGRSTADFCRPFHEEGPLVEVLRARLEDRARGLGWTLVDAPLADLRLVADGRVIRPDADGLTLRFVLPAEAEDVRLVSTTSVPAHVLPGSSDDRRLGVALAALTLDDGLTGARTIALDDMRLGQGFHAIEAEGEAEGKSVRWTDGAAVLPASLWAGCRGTVFLRVALARPALPRWVGPRETAEVVELSEFRRSA